MKRLAPWLASLVVLASFVASAAPPASLPAARAPLPRDSVYQVPLKLTAHDGRRFTWGERRGKPQLVAMFYTSCQYICPLIVDSGKAIEHALEPAARGRLGILLVSMDPARDTPAALLAVLRQRKLDPRRWTLASPAAADVRQVAGVLGVRYRALDDGEFNHTSALLLLDADGRIVARTEKVGSIADPEFLAAVRKVTTPRAR